MRRAGLPRAIRYGAIVLLALSLPGIARAQDAGEGGDGGVSKFPAPANAIDLLAPAGPLLSGRPWLMTIGMEPARLNGSPEGGPIGVDWQAFEGGFPSSGATLQAPSAGALVPYRNPGPAFSSNVLVTRDFS